MSHKITVHECADMFHMHRTTLGKYILKRDPDYNSRRKYSLDEHFFENINTEEKAYILGFFTADGCIKSKHGDCKIALSEKDGYILEEINKIMKNEKPLIRIENTHGFDNANPCVELVINSTKIYDQLVNCGFSPQKTQHEIFCDKVPKELHRHYIRGIFDGDGWFSFTDKNSTKEIGFGMGESILHSIRDVLIEEAGISPKYNVKPYKTIFRYRITSTDNVLKMFHFFYDDATIYLKRKHDMMENFCRLKTSSQKS